MRVSEFAQRHQRFLLALLAVMVLGGLYAATNLPVGLFPNVAFPRIAVSIEAGDRPIDQTETSITRPLEQAVRSVPGVTSLRSTTSRGAAEISINFAWGSDMNLALQRIQDALTRTAALLPPGVTFSARRMDPTVFPVAAYSLTSDRIGPVELRRYADQALTPLLSSIDGVSRVDVLGGAKGEYRVEIDPAKLRAFGVGQADVVQALGAGNVIEAAGKLEDRGKLYLALTDTRLASQSDCGYGTWPRCA